MIAAIALDRAKLQQPEAQSRFNVGDKTIKRIKERIIIGTIGRDVVWDDERDKVDEDDSSSKSRNGERLLLYRSKAEAKTS
jgi:hypothetical protein